MYNLNDINFVVINDVVYLCINNQSVLHDNKQLKNLGEKKDFYQYIKNNENCYYSIGFKYASLVFLLKKYSKSEIAKNIHEIRRKDIANNYGWNYSNVFKYIKNKTVTKEELYTLWKDLQKSFLDEKIRHQLALKKEIGFSRSALKSIKVGEINKELSQYDFSRIKKEYPQSEFTFNK